MTNQDIENAVRRIATSSRQVMMTASVRDIQKALREDLGFSVSTSTIASVLKNMGLNTKPRRKSWSWKHNEPAEDVDD